MRRGNDSMVLATVQQDKRPTLSRTDTDQRNFQLHVSRGLRQYGTDSQPFDLTGDTEVYKSPVVQDTSMVQRDAFPDYVDWCLDNSMHGDCYHMYQDEKKRWYDKHPPTTTTTTGAEPPRSPVPPKKEEMVRCGSDNEDDTAMYAAMDAFEATTAQPSEPVADTSESELQKGVADVPSKERGKFRLRNKQIGLTYPQCPIDKAEMRNHLDKVCSKYDANVVVSQEKHNTSDGLHLHAYIKTESPISTRDPHFFDFKKDGNVYTPHITIIKFAPGWIKYLTKSDKQPACTPGFDIEQFVVDKYAKKATISGKLASMIQQGAKMKEIYTNFGGFMMLHAKQVEEYARKLQEYNKVEKNAEKWSSVLRFEAPLDQTF